MTRQLPAARQPDTPPRPPSVRTWLLGLTLAGLLPGTIAVATWMLHEYREERALQEAQTLQTARAL
ncbi:MAG TPA: hypothetical protein VFH22_03065, partial [Rhodocyclaceae bacterium]|nr:hypothetical protein [Rhodocyclaceae bacterium]